MAQDAVILADLTAAVAALNGALQSRADHTNITTVPEGEDMKEVYLKCQRNLKVIHNTEDLVQRLSDDLSSQWAVLLREAQAKHTEEDKLLAQNWLTTTDNDLGVNKALRAVKTFKISLQTSIDTFESEIYAYLALKDLEDKEMIKQNTSQPTRGSDSHTSTKPDDFIMPEPQSVYRTPRTTLFSNAHVRFDNPFATEVERENGLGTLGTRRYPPFERGIEREREQSREVTRECAGEESSDSESDESVPVKRVDIPTFSGEPGTFEEWWAIFTHLVHKRKKMKPMQKVLLLKRSLKGEAELAVRGIPAVPANYDRMIKQILKRYDVESDTQCDMAQKLQDMPRSDTKVSNLKRTFFKIQELVNRMVTAHNDITLSTDPMYLNAITSKFPYEITKDILIENHRKTVSVLRLLDQIDSTIAARYTAERGQSRLYQDTLRPREKEQNQGRQPERQTHPERHPPSERQYQPAGNRQFPSAPKVARGCAFCDGPHKPASCDKIMVVAQRRQIVKKRKLCWTCFENHPRGQCKFGDRLCTLCNLPHDESLCKFNPNVEDCSQWNPRPQEPQSSQFYGQPQGQQPLVNRPAPVAQNQTRQGQLYEPTRGQLPPINRQPPFAQNAAQSEKAQLASSQVVLMTAEGRVFNKYTQQYETALFFVDKGAQKSMVVENLAQKLGCEVLKEELCTMGGIGGKVDVFPTKQVQLEVLTPFGETIRLEALTRNALTVSFSAAKVSPEDAKIIREKRIFLGNPRMNGESQTPEIIIGMDLYHRFVYDEPLVTLPSGLKVSNTVLGCCLEGSIGANASNTQPIIATVATVPEQSVNDMVKNLYQIETSGINDDEFGANPKAQQYYESYKDQIQFKDQEVFAPFPLSENICKLHSNFPVALKRLQSLTESLRKNPEIGKWYYQIMQEYIETGVVEPADSMVEGAVGAYYMPHSGVWKPEKVTKPLRIVFDASAKSKGRLSLNEVIHTGESFVTKFADILVKSRIGKILMLCDIQAAFTQIRLVPEHKDLCRFLYLKDPSKPPDKENLLVLRFTRLPFGITASPSILNMAITTFLKRKNTPLALEILNNIYVDNVLLTAETAEEALQKYKESKALFQEIGMNLREFVSSSNEVNEAIPEVDRGKIGATKLLGVPFNTDTDEFSVDVDRSAIEPLTKKAMLAELHSVFDPQGAAHPAMIELRNLMRYGLKDKPGWKDVLSPEFAEKWNAAWEVVLNTRVTLPRATPFKVDSLWIFADASTKGTAVCAYFGNSVTQQVSTLVYAKSQLAPLKPAVTIPKLELIAIQTAARLAKTIVEIVGVQLQKVHILSDSQIALSWIKSTTLNNVFVRNRVDRIKQNLSILENNGHQIQLYHVATSHNTADIGTRGLAGTDLNRSDWIKGPQWLTQTRSTWPVTPMEAVLPPEESEIDPEPIRLIQLTQTVKSTPIHRTMDLGKYNRFDDLLRDAAATLRSLKDVNTNESPAVTDLAPLVSTEGEFNAEDIALAERLLLREEHESLSIPELEQRHKQTRFFKDEAGIIRAESRITNANLPRDTRNPIILIPNSKLTELIVQRIHEENAHVGKDHSLTILRQRFWLPQPSRTIKKILNSCVACKMANGRPFKAPHMASLPSDRVREARAFETAGCDYMGPIQLTQGHKVYVCLFTCLTTRAVHLEVVDSLSGGAFLNTFKRFISRRGTPRLVRSDCGTNFKLGERVIDLLYQKQDQSDDSVMSYCSMNGIQWIFNPPGSPWMGGVWERLVGSVKSCLSKAIGRKKLKWEDFHTAITQIEAILNTRPLTSTSPDDLSVYPLRPVDFLRGNVSFALPPADSVDASDPDFDIDQIQTVDQAIQAMETADRVASQFWDRWRSEYLTSLRDTQRQRLPQGRTSTRNAPFLGEIVMISNENLSRGQWQLGKVTKLIHSADGAIRSAKVLLRNGNTWHRPIAKLIPLEIRSFAALPELPSDNPDESDNPSPNADPVTPTEEAKTQRATDSANTSNDVSPEGKTDKKPRAAKTRGQERIRAIARQDQRADESDDERTENVRKAEQERETSNEGPAQRKTRKSSQLATALMLMAMIALTDAVPDNSFLKCDHGVLTVSPPVHGFTLCFEKNCQTFPATKVHNSYHVPPSAKPWTNVTLQTQGFHVWRLCEPVDTCQFSSALLSKHLIGNPQCWPNGALVSIAVLLTLGLLSLMLIGRAVYAIIECRKNQEAKIETPEQESDDEAMEMTEFLRRPSFRTQITKLRGPSLMMIFCLLTILTKISSGCQEGFMRHSVEMGCSSDGDCQLHDRRELLFDPLHRELCIGITQKNLSIGHIRIRRLTTILSCLPQTEYFTRDSEIKVFKEFRCPGMGSCGLTERKCEDMHPDDAVPELQMAEPFPGYATCDTQGCWPGACFCLFPGKACTFYKVAHVPVNEKVFHVFDCPQWNATDVFEVELTFLGNFGTVKVALLPYVTTKVGPLRLTLISAQTPNLPALTNRFATSDDEGFMFPREETLHIQCPKHDIALNDFKSCKNTDTCSCSSATVKCICPPGGVSRWRGLANRHLPITTPEVTVHQEGGHIFALTNSGELTLVAESSFMANSSVFTVKTKCQIETEPLQGCYNCATGSQVNVTCHAEINTWVTVQCDSHHFPLQCGVTPVTNTLHLPFAWSAISESCKAECGHNTELFAINGTLDFHSEVLPFPLFVPNSTHPNVNPWDWFQDTTLPDFRPLLRTIREHWILAVSLLGSIGLITGLCYIFGPVGLLYLAYALKAAISVAWHMVKGVANLMVLIAQSIRSSVHHSESDSGNAQH